MFREPAALDTMPDMPDDGEVRVESVQATGLEVEQRAEAARRRGVPEQRPQAE